MTDMDMPVVVDVGETEREVRELRHDVGILVRILGDQDLIPPPPEPSVEIWEFDRVGSGLGTWSFDVKDPDGVLPAWPDGAAAVAVATRATVFEAPLWKRLMTFEGIYLTGVHELTSRLVAVEAQMKGMPRVPRRGQARLSLEML